MQEEWWRCIYVHPRAAEVAMHGVRRRKHLHPRTAEVAMQGVRGREHLHPRPAEVAMQGVRGREHLHPRPGKVAMQGVRRREHLHPRQGKVAMQGVWGREHLHPRPAEVAMQGVCGAAAGADIVQHRSSTIPFHAWCKRWQGGYTKAPCTANPPALFRACPPSLCASLALIRSWARRARRARPASRRASAQ